MKAAIRIVFIASLPIVLTAGERQKACMSGMRKALIEGHFTGELVCSKKYATFELIGKTAGRGFSIYNYIYSYKHKDMNTAHGGQKMVIFLGSKYYGQYMLLPEVTIAVQGKYVVLQGDDVRDKVALDFSRKPPGKILVNGEPETFYR